MKRRYVNRLQISSPFLLAACVSPGSSEGLLTRIGFGSCLDQEIPAPILKSVRAHDPDVFIFLSDNVHGNVSSGEIGQLRGADACFGPNEDFQALQRGAEMLATWDIHDYGANDAEADIPWRKRAEQIFPNFWDVLVDEVRRRWGGIYTARIIGPPSRRVQITLLGTLLNRSGSLGEGAKNGGYVPGPNPAKTLLGTVEINWAAGGMKPAPRNLAGESAKDRRAVGLTAGVMNSFAFDIDCRRTKFRPTLRNRY